MQNKRTFGIALISIVVAIEAIFQILAALAMFGLSTAGFFTTPYTGVAGVILAIGILTLVIGIVELVVAAGMWSMEYWTWMLAVIICWIDIIFDIIGGFIYTQTFAATVVSMIIPLIVLIYFYQPKIRQLFVK